MGGPEGFSGLQGGGQLLWAPVECMGFPSGQKEEGFGVEGGSECGKKSSGVLGRCLLSASVEGLGKVTGAHSVGVSSQGFAFLLAQALGGSQLLVTVVSGTPTGLYSHHWLLAFCPLFSFISSLPSSTAGAVCRGSGLPRGTAAAFCLWRSRSASRRRCQPV